MLNKNISDRIVIVKDWPEIVFHQYLTEKAREKFKLIYPGSYMPDTKVQLVFEPVEFNKMTKKNGVINV